MAPPGGRQSQALDSQRPPLAPDQQIQETEEQPSLPDLTRSPTNRMPNREADHTLFSRSQSPNQIGHVDSDQVIHCPSAGLITAQSSQLMIF